MNNAADIRRANLGLLVKRDGLSSVARRAGKPDRQINDMLAGRKSFGEKVARAIERSLDPSRAPGWLDIEHETNLSPLPSTNTTAQTASGTINTNVDTDLPAPSDDNYALIPQYTAKAACGPAYHNGHVEVKGGLAFKRDWLSSLGLKPANLSVIAANGYSMSPTIQEGEVLLIDHSQIEPRDGKVFALARDDELVVKRLVRDFSGGWIIRSDNPDKTRYPDFHAVSNELRVVGRVVWRGGGL